MNNQYISLFKEICNMTSILAEQVMDVDKKNNDEHGYETAQTMRDDYNSLTDRLADKNFSIDSLKKEDYLKILAGAMIVSSNMQDRINIQQKVVDSYKMMLIPKLDRVINEGADESSLKNVVKECFLDE